MMRTRFTTETKKVHHGDTEDTETKEITQRENYISFFSVLSMSSWFI